MSESLPDSVSGFLAETSRADKSLLLVNRTVPREYVNLLDTAFESQPVSVAERQLPEGPENLVCLLDGGEVVATSPFARLEEAFLMVNADRYRTGNRQIERGQFPDVLTGLDDVTFSLRGYPESAKEKLLLVVISRFVEFRALERGAGELHTTFQHLSRVDDEYGTRRVYEWLGQTDVETHVYGIRDGADAIDDLEATVHEAWTPWVVVFTPPGMDDVSDDSERGVALVAVEDGPNFWRGKWTYDSDEIRRIRDYVRREF